MKFSELLQKIAEKYQISNIISNQDCDITDLSLYDADAESFNDNTIYFIDGAISSPNQTIPKSILYYHGMPDELKEKMVNSAQIDERAISAVFQNAKQILGNELQDQKSYSEILNMLLNGCNLNQVLSAISDKAGGMHVIIDVSGKVLAHSEPFLVDYSVWARSIERGFCNETLMQYIEERRRTAEDPFSTEPFVVHCDFLDLFILCSRVIKNHSVFGYVFIINKENEFEPLCRQLLPMITRSARDLIVDSSGYHDFRATMYHNILSDMISGATERESYLRINAAKLKFPDRMRAVCARQDYYTERMLLEKIIRPQLVDYQDIYACVVDSSTLIMIVKVDKTGTISEQILEKMEQLTNQYPIRFGMSNVFTEPSKFATYYRQAITAISHSRRLTKVKKLCSFSDFSFYDVLDNVSDHEVLKNCRHHAIIQLAEYDKEKHSDLYNTLKIYTECGFNCNQTASQMFLHRNTVKYRLQQIEDICGIDLNDSSLIFPFQLTFAIDSYLNQP